MNSSVSTIAAWSYALAAIAHLALVMFLLPRQVGRHATGERDPIALVILVAAGLTLLWATGTFLATPDGGEERALSGLLDVILYAGWYAVPLALIFFSPDRPQIALRLGRMTVLVLSAGLICVMLPVVVPSAEMYRMSRYATLGLAVFGLLLLEQVYRNAIEDSRWTIKPLAVGLGAAFVFDLYFHSHTLLFNKMDASAYAVRGFAYALVVPLVTLTLLRPRSRKLKVAISKNVAFHTTTLMVAGLYLLLASAAGYYVRFWGGSWGGALQLAVLFSAFVLLALLALSRTAQARLRVLVGKHFFRYRFDYREEWLRFTRTITTEDKAVPLGQRVIVGLADMVESPAGSLWLYDTQSTCYVQSARWNLPETLSAEPRDSVLMKFLSDKGWVINLEEYRIRPGRYVGLVLPEWLSSLNDTWLIVPLKATKETIGFVVLATSRTPMDVNWEVNDLLKTAGSQAASYLAQMLATEALLEARKFEAFNRMSAFVVHDLKNIVSQLSLLVRNAEKHADNPEFQHDMLLTVSHSVERMKQLMLQLREGATPISGGKGVGVANVARRVHTAKLRQFPALTLSIRSEPFTRGHEDRIERVVGHLVQNAIDATPTEGQIWIVVDKEDGAVVIEVGDTGKGMSEAFVRSELFKPFYTTKDEGMGIGAYESYQYVKELGGNIVVESKLGEGSRFRIVLPLAGGESASAPASRAVAP